MTRDDTTTVPDYVVAMVRRSPPDGCRVVAGSTPVVAFGDAMRAEIATLGINPSVREFVEKDRLLRGDRRRLATLESLGAANCDELTHAQVAAVVTDCATYFQRRPYRWFNPLDELLRAGTGTSYYDGSACHLDLVQWATDPVWGRLEERVRQTLLDDGVPHLRAQLSHENVRVVLLNGRRVLSHVEAVGLTQLTEVDRLPIGRTTCRLYTGMGSGIRWFGWSANLQSSWGVSNGFKTQLAAWLADAAASATAASPAEDQPAEGQSALTANDHLPRNLRVTGKAALIDAFRTWLTDSDSPTIGDVGSFGGRPWLVVDVDGSTVALNADTKRAAVETVVRDHTSDADRPWQVVANRRGTINKVVPGQQSLPGWYAYLVDPLEDEAAI